MKESLPSDHSLTAMSTSLEVLSVSQLFERQVELKPDTVGVVCGEAHLTYHEFNLRANRLAFHLQQLGVGPEVVVGICVERSLEMMIGIFGILKAGGAYVPLDPAYPSERIAFILDDTQAPLLLTQASFVDRLPRGAAQIFCLDTQWSQINQEQQVNPVHGLYSGNLAYIIYTSGSTGKPKGVLISHHNLIHSTWSRLLYYPDPITKFLLVSPFVFDSSVAGIFWTLCQGGTLLITQEDLQHDPLQLANLINSQSISHLLSLPSLYNLLLMQAKDQQLASLRTVIVAGEACSRDLVELHHALLPNTPIYNEYGPTEGTVWCSVYRYHPEERHSFVPIGGPIPNTQIYILDPLGYSVEVGIEGELYIGGEGLARGYLHRPELTAEWFVPDPFNIKPGTCLYKTGDLACYLPDGNIRYIGRIDYQVKVRGYRIELGEIEAILSQHPAVQQVVVLAWGETLENKRLVAYVVGYPDQELRTSALRYYIQERLPEYMVPGAFISLETLPLTSSGKVDRQALPAPDLRRPDLEVAFVSPRTPTEAKLVDLWTQFLQIEQLGIYDNFFTLGGHSLLAMRLIFQIQEAFQCHLSLHRLFEAPTIADLAQYIERSLEDKQFTPRPPLKPVPRRETLPSSFAQQRLWFLNQLDPNSTAYNIPLALYLQGPLVLDALQQSIQTLVERHEALRTTFVLVHDLPQQCIASHLNISIPLIDLLALSAENREREWSQALIAEARHAFDLAHGPLLHASIFRLTDRDHILLITIHHIISDGWSQGIFIRELNAIYTASVHGQLPAALPPLPIQYADYAFWQREWLREEVLERQLTYWRQHLAGAPALLELPTDHPRPVTQSDRGATVQFLLPENLVRHLHPLSQQEGATLYMALLTTFAILLYRYSGQSDLVIGTPIAGRTHRETEAIIGLFANTLALHLDLAGRPSVRELLRRVRTICLGAYEHQEVPFEKLVEDLQPVRSLSYNPLFQVLFALQNMPVEVPSLMDVSVTPLEIQTTTTKFDLSMTFQERADGLLGRLEYSTDLFEETTIQRMIGHYCTLLTALVASSDRCIDLLPILTEGECQQLVEWNQTSQEYPQQDCIHRLFEVQAQQVPEAIALVFEDQHLSYGELDQRTNLLASYLQQSGVGPEILVGVGMERSLELIVALLAVLKAGGAYVPLAPSYPQERLLSMMQDARITLLLTQTWLLDRLPHNNLKTLCLDGDWRASCPSQPEKIIRNVHLDNLIYTIYTSGSTGKPKGVMNTHRGVCNRLHWMQQTYQLTFEDRILQKTPFSFDVSVWEFFWPLLTGACLVIAHPGGHQDPDYLVSLIAEKQITMLHFVPSMLRAFLMAPDLEQCKSLKHVFCSGEALPFEVQKQFFSSFDVALHNLYGPTEAAIDVTYWQCQRESLSGVVPIGWPIANTQTYVLDQNWQPVPIGVSGELCIGGVGVARGYSNHPELTAEKFIPDPFGQKAGTRLYKTGDVARYLPDGTLEYLGRNDTQVKIRGFRIELGEIENALVQHPGIQTGILTTQKLENSDQRLVAYLIPRANPIPVEELRRFLSERLPEYMLPALFVWIETLPVTINGKIDYAALPEPDSTRSGFETVYVPPLTRVERELVAIWASVLKLERIGIYDNFFTLGGDSLKSVQVLALAREQGICYSLQQQFQFQTIYELAQALSSSSTASREALPSPSVPFSLLPLTDRQKLSEGLEDAFPLTHLQTGMLFHSEYSPGSVVYHNVVSFQVCARFSPEAMSEALRFVIARHPLLRTSFHLSSFSIPLQLVHQPECIPLPLEVVDICHLSVLEQRELLATWWEAERYHKFNWQDAPLFRIRIHLRSADSFQLTYTEHHAILDGWSVASLFTELFSLYSSWLEGTPPLPQPLLITYRDFVGLEKEALASSSCQVYWTKQAQESTMLRLPRWSRSKQGNTDRPGYILTSSLPLAITEGVKQVAQLATVSFKSVLLAAHLRVLQCLSGQTDITTGLVCNGRPEVVGGERVLGLFLNTLPFRVSLKGGTWIALAQQTFQAEQDLLPFRRYPLAEIQRLAGGQPLFEILFNFVHFHIYDQLHALPNIRILEKHEFDQTHFALVTHFSLESDDTLQLTLECNAVDISEEQLQIISHYYITTLAAIANDPYQRYEHCSPLVQAEQGQDLNEWNGAESLSHEGLCVHQLFEIQAKQTPEAMAVVYEEQQLTYQELNRRANQLAHHLQRLGVGPEVVVGLCLERSPELVIGLLGILKAGGAYMPLDPTNPQQRLAFLVQDAQPTVVLTQQQLVAGLPAHQAKLLCLDTIWQQIACESEENLISEIHPDNLIYIIYTSGSTGSPKGSLLSHRNVVGLFAATSSLFHFNEQDSWTLFHSYAFDFSVWELWGALLHGGRLVIVPSWVSRSSEAFYRLLAQEHITILNQTPSAFQYLLRLEKMDAATETLALRLIIFGGEILEWEQVRPWLTRPDNDLPYLVNMYGITETTVHVTYRRLISADGRTAFGSPIGQPLADLQTYVLDPHLQPVPIGLLGELYIGGRGISRGYLRRPDLTAERFVPHPWSAQPGARLYRTGDLVRSLPNGNLEYLGRIDTQVKVRGFRVELGEIEACLQAHPAVREALVLLREDTPGDKRLVAYVVATQEQQPTRMQLRSWLGEHLPAYMVPSVFVMLEQFPLTSNHKIDRRSLPLPDTRRFEPEKVFVAPQSTLELQLAQIFESILGFYPIGVTDNFIELGGHSLLMIQLVSQVRDTFHTDLPLRTLFDKPTIADLAQALEKARETSVGHQKPEITAVSREVYRRKRDLNNAQKNKGS